MLPLLITTYALFAFLMTLQLIEVKLTPTHQTTLLKLVLLQSLGVKRIHENNFK